MCAMKQATGLSYNGEERLLGSFAAHAEAQGDQFVQVATVLDWASQAPSPRAAGIQAPCRVRVCRVSACRGRAPRNSSPRRLWVEPLRNRPPPHLLSLERYQTNHERCAGASTPAGSITPHTFHTIIGLLAATGMRRSEAVGLRIRDLTEDGLEVHNAKFGKARLVTSG